MGLDINYQAMPDDCQLLDLVRQGKLEGFFLFDLQSYSSYTQNDESKINKDYLTAYKIVQALVDVYPGIENRIFNTRLWDIFLYFSSDNRRKTDTFNCDNDIFRRLILGDNLIYSDHNSSDRQDKVYFLPSNDVKSASVQLDGLSDEHLESWYIEEVMESLNVYRFYTFGFGEGGFQSALTGFNEFRGFVHMVAEHDEGIVCQMY